jgi:hypothetical protein
MQLSGLSAVKALGKVICIKEVEVSNLRALRTANAKKMPCGHLESSAISWRYDNLIDFT